MLSYQLSVLLLSVVVVGVHCYSTGAPASACTDIYPVNHTGPCQDLSTNPFTLSLSNFDPTYGGEIYYVPGQQYTLTLSGSGGEQFRGFLVQARAAADGSPVGTFEDNGNEQTLSSCSPPKSAVTHSTSALKSSVELRWTAPSHEAKEIQFLFSIVVQNSAGISVFYATTRTRVLHSCGLPLYESDGHCVETCPDGQFGNGNITTLTGTCDPLPSDVIALNATVYYADVHVDQPLNTPVFKIRAFFGSTTNFVTAHIRLSQTGQINKLFEFEGVANDNNSIDITNLGGASVFDTSINLVQHPDTEFADSEYPVTLSMDITFEVFYVNTADHVTSKGMGSIQDACSNMPCINGHCTPNVVSQSQHYTCDCFTGFTGINCDENIDDCQCNKCVSGTCIDGIEEFSCECEPGFTSTLCDQEINECDTVDCNNGTCTDLVNDYMCECFPYYTGRHCDALLSCSFSPCENGATCIDEEQGTFLCLCPPEWTGMTCSEDALPCDPNPCSNGGTCSENGAGLTCDCAVGWTGTTCADDDQSLTFCQPNLCVNGGSCNEDYGPHTNCSCASGFTGELCQEDDPSVTFCKENSCLNGGTCFEVYGDATVCLCSPGYCAGTRCAEVIISCASAPCENGGTCVDDEDYSGAFKCLCPPGWAGETCTDTAPLTEADPEQFSSLAFAGGAALIIILLFGLAMVGFFLACVLACRKKPGRKIAYPTAAPKNTRHRHDSRTDYDGTITSNCNNTSAIDLSSGDRPVEGLESQEEMWQFPPESRMEDRREDDRMENRREDDRMENRREDDRMENRREEDRMENRREDSRMEHRRAFRPVETAWDNIFEQSSPTASLIQYHLTLAMNAEAEAEEMEQEES